MILEDTVGVDIAPGVEGDDVDRDDANPSKYTAIWSRTWVSSRIPTPKPPCTGTGRRFPKTIFRPSFWTLLGLLLLPPSDHVARLEIPISLHD